MDKLVAVLKSEAPQKEKADACRELARLGTKDAVPALAALLGDEKLSHMARYGLETIPDPAVDRAFLDALGQLHGRSLAGVVGSIGVRRDSAAVKPLANLLHDSDADVAQAAARSLGSIGTSAAVEALQAALGAAPGAQQLALCEGLFRCADALAAKGERRQAMGIYDRLRALQAPHQVRTAALRGAILTRGNDGLPLLSETLRNEDFLVFAAAARTSQEMPGPRATLALVAALEKLPAKRQLFLIQTLAKRADTGALPALFTNARKGELPVRVAALRALAELGSPTAVPVLEEMLDDAERTVAQAAEESLAGLPGKEVDAAVLAMLARPEPNRRLKAIDLIARRRMTAAAPELLKTASADAAANVRVAAVKKLGGLAGAGELPALLDLLARAKSPEDLEAAEQAVSTVCLNAGQPVACVEKLAAALSPAQPAQKCALLRALTAVGGASALKCIRAAVSDSVPEVRGAAIRALADWSSAEAAPDLLELARAAANPTEKSLCLRGYLGFARRSEVPEAQRLAMCRQAAGLVGNDVEKKLLLAALGSINSTEGLALIRPYLDDAAVREEAGSAAVGIAEKLLQGPEAGQRAPKLIEPLEQVARATRNTDLAGRTKTLLEQARAKANAK